MNQAGHGRSHRHRTCTNDLNESRARSLRRNMGGRCGEAQARSVERGEGIEVDAWMDREPSTFA